jgi:hypothetical protein
VNVLLFKSGRTLIHIGKEPVNKTTSADNVTPA